MRTGRRKGTYDQVGALETIAIRLGVWTGPTDVEVPPFPWARVLVTAGVLAAVVGVAVVALVGEKDESARRERVATEAERGRIVARIKVEQAPHRARLGPGLAGTTDAGERAAGRERLVSALERAITADAQARHRRGALPAAITRTECGPFERRRGSDAPGPPPSAKAGRYECFAVSGDLPPTEGTEAGVAGFPFWARVDLEHGSAVWCKVRPKPAEGGATGSIDVRLPRVCELRRG